MSFLVFEMYFFSKKRYWEVSFTLRLYFTKERSLWKNLPPENVYFRTSMICNMWPTKNEIFKIIILNNSIVHIYIYIVIDKNENTSYNITQQHCICIYILQNSSIWSNANGEFLSLACILPPAKYSKSPTKKKRQNLQTLYEI